MQQIVKDFDADGAHVSRVTVELSNDSHSCDSPTCARKGDGERPIIHVHVNVPLGHGDARTESVRICGMCLVSSLLAEAIEGMRARGQEPPAIAIMIGGAPIAFPQADGGMTS